MPRNDNKVPCSAPGCRAWAVRGSLPPRCAPHAGLTGAPPGNDNRLLHGFYARHLHAPDLDALAGDRAQSSALPRLRAEVAIVRFALHRTLSLLVSGHTPGPDPQPLSADDYARLIGLTFQGAGTLGRLLRTQAELLPASRPVEGHFHQALGELSQEWGIDLLDAALGPPADPGVEPQKKSPSGSGSPGEGSPA